MAGVISFFNPLFGQVADTTSAATAEAARLAAEQDARKNRLNSMANTLGSETSKSLASITDAELNILDPATSDAFKSRRDTILTRRAQPGRAQTVLANAAQRY